ncbi:MAG: aminoglycoside phosphotransferase family protein [Actinobacteria bacterium]|nr:aminoglycoside phosphotransferase family protein [Actinomycetota bacterium]
MLAGSIEQRALAAARAVAAEHGVPCQRAEVVNSGSNVLVHLLPSPVMARVMSGTVALHDDPELWLTREVAVLSFLAPSGLAVAPSPLIDSGPYQRDGLWITFCEWVEHRSWSPLEDPERLGAALRDLHQALSRFPDELAGFADLQRDIERLRRQLVPTAGLSAERIDSLGERLQALGDTLFEVSWPSQPLHGDASISNLLRTPAGLVWNDFEDTFRGPVQWDLAGYVMDWEYHGADSDLVRRALDAYGWGEREELEPFIPAHEVYGEIWRLYDAQRRG